ncbi:ATP-binding protein [Aquiflexum sp. TKW24L]|uniref:sensor histidine kinase n=1 Tax=Aquiflexum sp. TKW24L TaxID=2942212 RepID=UPI0020BE897A|nr:ATP-binding protein [Aquiflexum sp. TKW24L]MCL6257815.1 ATP-binding protein [Aquiflexum sp. TKW24L]
MNLRFLITISFIFYTFKVAAQELPFVHYTPDNEVNQLPTDLATYVFQDSERYIWMSVHTSGLVRFDGDVMEVYTDKKDGLIDHMYMRVVEDELGYLWVSSNGGLVVSKEPVSNYKNGRRISFTAEFDGKSLYKDRVWNLIVDKDGMVWIYTELGFLRYKIDETQNLKLDTISTYLGSGNEGVTSVYSGNSGVILGLSGGKLARFTGNAINVIYSSPINLNDQDFVSILEEKDGKIWAIKQNGELIWFEKNSFTPKIISKSEDLYYAKLISIAGEEVWAVKTNGILRFDIGTGEKIGSISMANGLLGYIEHVINDVEGNVWIAQSGGVSKLRYNFNAFKNFGGRFIQGQRPILPSPRVNTILKVPEKSFPFSVLAGTEGGVSCISEDGTSTYITQADGLIGDWVNGLEMDIEGRIWIATTQGLNGLVFDKKLVLNEAVELKNITINGETGFLFTIPNSPPIIASEKLIIKGPSETEDISSIWFAGLRSIFGVVEGRVFEFGVDSGLPSVLFKSIAMDAEGYLWVGTLDKGIYRSTKKITKEFLYQTNSNKRNTNLFEQYWSISNGAPTNHIEKLLWYKDQMWIGTQKGLFLVNLEADKINTQFTMENGLPADNAISFAVNPINGNIWAGTNKGLAEINGESNQVVRTISRQEGLIDNEVWLYGSVRVDEDGLIYYGTAKGLSIYNPLLDRKNNISPIVELDSVLVSYQTAGRNEAVFKYHSISFANKLGVKYKTRLLGYEEEWSPETNQRQLRYTNLPAYFWPRSYTLEVIAINDSGLESLDPLRYTFMVKPVWWLRWWVILITVGLSGLGLFVFDKEKKTRLLRKEREIAKLREAELHAETAIAKSLASEAQAQALKADNEKKAVELEKIQELEKAYQELKSAQNQLIQAEKMASLGRLATGIAHEIKNPLNFVNNFAALSSELVDELTQAIRDNNQVEIDYLMENLKINAGLIEDHGKRADAIVRSMMQHTRQGKSTFEIVEINNLVEKYIDLTYNSKGVHNPGFFTAIKKDFQSNLKKVKISGQEIGQVLINIIGNAFDAVWEKNKNNPEGFEPEVSISTFMAGDKVGIRISDNGIGIPTEIQEKIFEPFFTTKPTGEGTGLGLSLSYEIVTHGHNGSLKLEKKNGEGASFVILLPVY